MLPEEGPAAGRGRLLMCDLDDTLVVRAPIFRTCAEGFLAELGRPELLDWFIAADQGGERHRDEFWSAVHDEIGDEVTVELCRGFQQRFAGSYRLEPATRQALVDARAEGRVLGVVTNGSADGQMRKVRAAGVDKLVDAICVSEEVGVSKPDPAIFEAAATRAGATLAGAWMIGDNLDTDIAGAQAVGARTVWLRPRDERVAARSHVQPDHVAGSFAEAVHWVLDATAGPADDPVGRPGPEPARASGSRC